MNFLHSIMSMFDGSFGIAAFLSELGMGYSG
jgi:hypothetical protein